MPHWNILTHHAYYTSLSKNETKSQEHQDAQHVERDGHKDASERA